MHRAEQVILDAARNRKKAEPGQPCQNQRAFMKALAQGPLMILGIHGMGCRDPARNTAQHRRRNRPVLRLRVVGIDDPRTHLTGQPQDIAHDPWIAAPTIKRMDRNPGSGQTLMQHAVADHDHAVIHPARGKGQRGLAHAHIHSTVPDRQADDHHRWQRLEIGVRRQLIHRNGLLRFQS